MPKHSVVKLTLAAALLATSAASPTLAAGTRSSQSLPSAKTSAALSYSASRYAPSRFSPPAVTPAAAISQNRIRLGGALSTLFGFLPPRVQDSIANALGQAGPKGEALCRLLGIPQCGRPDSTG